MSYSPSEHLDNCDSRLVFAKALYQTYPDARYQHKRWFSGSVSIEECDVVELEPPPPGEATTCLINVYCGKSFAGGVVWAESRSCHWLISFLKPSNCSPKDDALRKALLAWMAAK